MSSVGAILKNIFKTGFLRNVLIGTVIIAALFPAYETLFAYPRFLKALIASVEEEAQRTAVYFASSIRPGATNLTLSALPPAFDDMVTSVARDFKIIKLKVFDKSGRITYSTDPTELGQINTQDYFHKEVAVGKPYTVTVVKKTRSAEGETYDADVVETYVPLIFNGEFVGAFELYYDITKAKTRMDSTRARAAGGVYALAAGMIVVVVLVLLRASREELWHVEIENQLRQAERVRSLGNLAGGVAHEINNLLLPILALSKMTMKKFPDSSSDRKRMEKIVEASERAKILVAQVMAFGREDDSKMDFVDICQVVRETMELLHKTLHSTITLRQDLDDKTGTVWADAAQIRVTLVNLLNNAQDSFDGKTGVIDVSLRPIQVSPELARRLEGLKTGPYTKLSVSDSGKGMDDDTLARVFDPFFTTKEVGEGKGLGLSMVYGIIHRHGGAIDITSTRHVGTTVDIYLPLIQDRSSNAGDRTK